MTDDASDDLARSARSPARRHRIDGSVLARARAGDRDAHAAIYDEFATDVMTVARRMLGARWRAEDVMQDTFVEVIRSIESFRNDADIGTWIHRIAINKCLSQLRSHWWISRLDVDDADSLPPYDGQAAIDARLETERLLDQLPDLTRAVVWLHDAEGFTHGEIAALMGRSESFSKSQLARAHRRIRFGSAADRFEEEVDDLCVNAAKPV